MSKMLISDWKDVKHFNPNEKWGDWTKIEAPLIFLLDNFRDKIDSPIYISSGTQGEHSIGSYHYQGIAVDILFPKKNLYDLIELSQVAEDSHFNGIGVYNCWSLSNKITPGMHLDIRPGKIKRWIGIKEGYIQFTFKNLQKHFPKDSKVC